MNIKEAKTAELVAFYNEHTDKKIKKFVDRATAEKRCTELQKTTETHVPVKAFEPTFPAITVDGFKVCKVLRTLLYNYDTEPGFSDVTAEAIGKHLTATTLAIARILDRLVEVGLVRREETTVNRKAHTFLHFTELGRKFNVVNRITPLVKTEVVKPAKKATAPAPDGPKKQNTPPHLNLRCPSCGFYAKTTPEWLAKGRLQCPMNKAHGALLTAEERNEKRGR